MRIILLTAILLLTPLASRADALPELTNYLRSEISAESSALPAAVESMQPSEEGYFFRRWLVRLQATFGIDVPWIASFQVIPEVELVWQRPYPRGWRDYRPAPPVL